MRKRRYSLLASTLIFAVCLSFAFPAQQIAAAEPLPNQLAEVPESWTNVARGSYVRASSEQKDSKAQNAVDGIKDDDGNRWRTNSKNELHYLEIFLDKEYTITGADFETGYRHLNQENGKPEWALGSMRLEYWDGSAWQIIPGLSVSGNPANGNSLILQAEEPVKTDKVRFASDDATKGLRVREIEVYTSDNVESSVVRPDDSTPPELSGGKTAYTSALGQPVNISVTSNEELQNIIAYYWKNGESGNSKSAPFTRNSAASGYVYTADITAAEPGDYQYAIYAVDMGGNSVVLPGQNSAYSFSVVETAAQKTSGFSIEEGDVLSGRADIYVYTASYAAAQNAVITIDGARQESVPALPGESQFRFNGRSIDLIYYSQVSAKDADGQRKWLGRIKAPVNGWYTYDVDADMLLENGQTLTIHTGNDSVTYTLENHDKYFGKTNFDDFYVSNLHLLLPDGSSLMPETVTLYKGSGEVESREYHGEEYLLADDGPPQHVATIYPMMLDANFVIPAEKLTAAYVGIDTSTLTDGEHELSVTANGKIETIHFTVDNDMPEVESVTLDGKPIESGSTLRGNHILDIQTSKNKAELKISAKLDGTEISLPYDFRSLDFAEGSHTLLVTLKDNAGNSGDCEFTFNIGREYPEAEENRGSLNEGTLSLHVTDPNNDKLQVSFYKADKIKTQPENIRVFSGTADREPPFEKEIGTELEDITALSDADGVRADVSADKGFPFQRFEISLGAENLAEGKTLELCWQGASLPGRKVSLYAWNNIEGRWDLLASNIAADKANFVLRQDVDKALYVSDNKINALVQDQLLTENDKFTFLWTTDTQYYAKEYPEIFEQMFDWTVEQYKNGKFSYMINTGDIVDNLSVPQQWETADRNFRKLDDNNVPYGVLAGNHDVIVDTNQSYEQYAQHFGRSRYENNPWYGDDLDNNRNHYDLVSCGGQDFIIMYIGFGKENQADTIAWANEALQKYSDRSAILCLHAYLELDGTLSRMSQGVLANIVEPNPNVKMVLCGHYHGTQRNIREVTNPDGTKRNVIELLYDNQAARNGGDGYLRFLDFDPEAGTVHVSTYSPVLDEWNGSFGKDNDEFTLDFKFNAPEKLVSGDTFSVNIYTDEKLGETNVPSGSLAEIPAAGLTPEDYWYAIIENTNGAVTRSDVFGGTEPQTLPSESESEPDNPTPSENPSNSTGGGTVDKGSLPSENRPTADTTAKTSIPAKKEDSELTRSGATKTGEEASDLAVFILVLMSLLYCAYLRIRLKRRRLKRRDN